MNARISYAANSRGTLFTIEGELFQTGAAGTRCLDDVRSQFGEEAVLRVALEASQRMTEVRSSWPDSRRPKLAQGEAEINVEGLLLALGLSASQIPSLAAQYRSGSSASLDLRVAGAAVERRASSPSILFDGTADDVRAYLESVFGSSAFKLVGTEIELELPIVGSDKRPRPSGETVNVKVSAPASWSVQAPEGGSSWHVVPDGASATLCTIPLASWTTAVRRDDDHVVNCPWCRVRLIAIEIAAPPALAGVGGWTARCVYTMRHSHDLEAALDSGGTARWHENRGWKTGRELVEGSSPRESVPVIFSAADKDSGLIFYARLDAVNVDASGTTYEISGLRRLADARPLSSLTVASSGAPLPDSYIRPYAICRTPSFLALPDEASAQDAALFSSGPKLHEEIASILRLGGNAWQTTLELADEVNQRGVYKKKDRTPVTPFQIHGRTRNYPAWFEREGSRVRLWPDAPG